MKKSIVAALTLGAVIAFSPAAQAQDKKEAPKGKGNGPSLEERVKQMTETLKLTDEQKPKVEAILKEQGEKMSALRADQNTPQDERRTKMMEITKATGEKMKAVLTKEQGEQYDKFLAEAAAKRKKQ